MKADPLLFFDSVSFGYNRVLPPIINNLDLPLRQGDITTVLGPNGAGKTTLLLLALGWLRPWKGRVYLSGSPLESIRRRQLGQQIALIPQSEHIPFEYSVLEYVLLGRTPFLPPLGLPNQEDYELALQAMNRVGISDLAHQSIQSLSGGEKQLVLAARALAQQPSLLLLDEPTAHLDLSNKVRLVELLRQLKHSGTTILMTTHEPDLALAVSDQLVLMKKGQVFLSGSTEKVSTGENLSEIYGVPVKVKTLPEGKQVQWL